MSIQISGRHMDIGDVFRGQIEDRIGDAAQRYFDGGYSGRIIVEKSGSWFDADCHVRLDTGTVLQASGRAKEPQAAFEAAADRIEKRLRRYKRKLKSHNNSSRVEEAAYRIMSSVDDNEEEVAEDYAPAIVAESSVSVPTLSVAQAVVELDLKDSPVFVFRNGGNDQINIVYRREDGNIGWVDPASL